MSTLNDSLVGWCTSQSRPFPVFRCLLHFCPLSNFLCSHLLCMSFSASATRCSRVVFGRRLASTDTNKDFPPMGAVFTLLAMRFTQAGHAPSRLRIKPSELALFTAVRTGKQQQPALRNLSSLQLDCQVSLVNFPLRHLESAPW